MVQAPPGIAPRGINCHGQPQRKRQNRNAVTNLVEEYHERILLDDPTQRSSYRFRAALVTEAAEHGVPDRLITTTAGYSDTRCDRPGERLDNNALQGDWS